MRFSSDFRICKMASVYMTLLVCTSTHAVEFELLTIGDPGNPADLDYGKGRYGDVRYVYEMASNEVTVGQYVEFLNAVASNDLHELFEPQMESSAWGGVVRSGAPGNYSYSMKPHYENKPINFIGFWDAARFANWMHNGQPSGEQNASTTEDGVYGLHGVTYPPNHSVHRKANARWFIPSENEWYKAALYDPRTEAEGGPPEDDHYWWYATANDEPPTIAETNSVGDVSNPGPNVANYDFGARWDGVFGHASTVGSAESKSYYGLYDLMGNMWEWNESIVVDLARSETSTFRSVRGASWDDPVRLLRASLRGYGGIELCGTVWQCFNKGNGFRLGAVVNRELPDFDGDGSFDVDDIDLLSAEVRSQQHNAQMDLNADGFVNQDDRRNWLVDVRGVSFGDSNFDGSFNSTDVVIVFQLGQYDDGIDGNSTWRGGDWDGSGDFDSGDFVFAMQESRYENTAAIFVPEPSCGLSLTFSIFVMGFSWRSRTGRNRIG